MYKHLSKAILCVLLLCAAGCSTEEETEVNIDTTETTSPETTAAVEESSDPDFSSYFNEDGSWKGLDTSAIILPENYAHLLIDSDLIEPTEEELDEQMQYLLNSFTTTVEVTDRAVENGDAVNIDYVGYVDGEAFTGGNTNGYGTTVTAGSTEYIDDFLIQIIGHMPGETFDVNVTFPDPYSGNTELSGKDAVFVTTINYIEEDSVPELTDAFVQENLSSFASTADELREALRNEIIQTNLYNWFNSADGFSAAVDIDEVPEAMQEFQLLAMMINLSGTASQYGTTVEQLLEQVYGAADEAELAEVMADSFSASNKIEMIMQKIVEEQNITVTEEEVRTFLEEQGYDNFDSYKDYFGMPYLKNIVLREKASRFLMDNAVIE